MDLVAHRRFLAVTGSKLTTALWGVVLLAGLASQAHAGTFGICLFPATFGTGGDSSATYSTVNFPGGCGAGFSSSLQAGAVLNPSTLAAGLTSATLGLTAPMSVGGISTGTVSTSATASLDQGVLRVYGDSEGTLGGCGGSCQTTGGDAFPEAQLFDTLHFAITDAAASAIVAFHAHLDGIASVEAPGVGSYTVLEQWALGGSGCWQAAGGNAGNAFGPCLAGNGSYLTSSFTNQSGTGFDFSGTFAVTNGFSTTFLASLQQDCQSALCDFSNTASFSLSLPSDVTLTTDSGVLFSQPVTTAPGVPEPGTFGFAGAAVLLSGILRRFVGRKAAPRTLP
jgi:hypothetical protein